MADDEQLRVRRIDGEAWLVEISGEHDMTTAPLLAEQFDSLLEQDSLVIADVSQTTFLDSEVVRVFETATQRAAETPGVRFALVIDVENSNARRVLDLLRPLTGDIPTYSSVDLALAAHNAQQ
jgi:anti-anti-sigma regulatory factor